jgi:hypothetical protein
MEEEELSPSSSITMIVLMQSMMISTGKFLGLRPSWGILGGVLGCNLVKMGLTSELVDKNLLMDIHLLDLCGGTFLP